MTSPPSESSRPLSVVIPSYGRVERLPPLIDEYLRQGADQVVVVLDGPHPNWQSALAHRREEQRVTVRELPHNVGLARARIEGLRACRGDIVVAVDDDVEPSDGFLAAHRAFHEQGGDRVLLGYMPVALPKRRGADDAPTYLYAKDYERQASVWRQADSATILGSLWGGTVSLPRELYLRAEQLMPSVRLEYNEDLDLGLRLRQLGAEAVFDERALAAHHHGRNLKSYLRESFVRGVAISDLEGRWGVRPAQLNPLVEIPTGYSSVLRALRLSIARRDNGGLTQWAIIVLYRCAGAIRAFSLQDGLARLLRGALAMRGYRVAVASREREQFSGATG